MSDAPGPNVPFPPMEAELVSELPERGDWRYEPKWDGFRGVLENDGGELALWSRNGRPLLRYFPELRALGELLPPHSALDGEIVISRNGALDFDAMQMRLHPAESRVRKLSAEIPATFVAFDLLLWNKKKVHEKPIEERRAELEKVAGGISLSPVSDDIAQGRDWLQTLQAAGFDGVVAKKLGLPYLPGSRDGVVKVKPHKTADCVVAGLRWKAGGRETIATLLLGLYADDGHLDYVGSCAIGAKNQAEIAAKVLPLLDETERTPLLRAEPLGHERARGGAAEAGARRRGALRQAREAPLPPRDEAHPLPPGQGSRPVHVARGASRRAGPTTLPSRICSRRAHCRRRHVRCQARDGRSPRCPSAKSLAEPQRRQRPIESSSTQTRRSQAPDLCLADCPQSSASLLRA